jgi:hypothetical protein
MRLQREVGDESAKQYRTAYLLAAEDSEHKLCQTYRTYDVQILAGEAAGASLNPKQVQRSEQLRQRDQQEDGVLGLLHQRLRKYILGDVMGATSCRHKTELPCQPRYTASSTHC